MSIRCISETPANIKELNALVDKFPGKSYKSIKAFVEAWQSETLKENEDRFPTGAELNAYIQKSKKIGKKIPPIKWARTSPNSYEVSTRGDKRFSALVATFKEGTIIDGVDVGGRTIEDVYQSVIKKSRKGQAPAKDLKLYIETPKSNPFNISSVEESKRKQFAENTGISIDHIESPTDKDIEDYQFAEIVVVTSKGDRIQLAPGAGFQDLNNVVKDSDIRGLIGINYLLENYLKNHPSEVSKFGGSVLSSYAKDVYGSNYDATKDNFQGDYASYIKYANSKLYRTSVSSYTGNITPDANTIFVFGSNPEGRHGAGAAKVAREQFGAIYGQGEGLQGNAYALPTKDLRVKKNNSLRSISSEQIIESIKKLYETARQNPDKQFKVAYRNTDKASLNGYTGLEMIDMFLKAGSIPANIVFSKEWVDTGKFNLSREELEDFSYTEGYLPLWQEWARQNPELMDELRAKSAGKTLTDQFANTRVSQARALFDITQ